MSLRAIARELGVVSSAVYRYVKSRDELLTLLVVDAYTELGDEVDAAVANAAPADFTGQFLALARAVREWAVREPARYGLLYGSPVPGYSAPAEQTTGPGTRVITALVRIYDGAYHSGHPGAPPSFPDGLPLPEPDLVRDFDRIRENMAIDVPDHLIVRGTLAWAAIFGAVSFEVFGQYGPNTFSNPAQLFEQHLWVLSDVVGL